MAAILATLVWIRRWESVVRDAVARRKADVDAIRREPAVAAVLEAFPGAEIAEIRVREPAP